MVVDFYVLTIPCYSKSIDDTPCIKIATCEYHCNIKCHAQDFKMATLKEVSHSAVAAALGKISTSNFTCGGTLEAPVAVHLGYSDKTGQWHRVS